MPSNLEIMTAPARPRIDDTMLRRVHAEFLEMPGLCLTCEQAQRLWSTDEQTCRHLLDRLVEAKFLRLRNDGVYARLTDGVP